MWCWIEPVVGAPSHTSTPSLQLDLTSGWRRRRDKEKSVSRFTKSNWWKYLQSQILIEDTRGVWRSSCNSKRQQCMTLLFLLEHCVIKIYTSALLLSTFYMSLWLGSISLCQTKDRSYLSSCPALQIQNKGTITKSCIVILNNRASVTGTISKT